MGRAAGKQTGRTPNFFKGNWAREFPFEAQILRKKGKIRCWRSLSLSCQKKNWQGPALRSVFPWHGSHGQVSSSPSSGSYYWANGDGSGLFKFLLVVFLLLLLHALRKKRGAKMAPRRHHFLVRRTDPFLGLFWPSFWHILEAPKRCHFPKRNRFSAKKKVENSPTYP